MGLFPKRERRRALRAAAVDYARRGWFVVPGTHIVHDGRSGGRHSRARRQARPLRCSCRQPMCPVPGEHPAAPDWQIQATYDPEAVSWWWSGRDVPNVVLPTGWSFDVLHVPSGLGTRVFGRFRDPHLAVPLGPVVRSDSGDWWFFVDPTADHDQPWLDRLAALGVRHLGPGAFLLAPPSVGGAAGGVGWMVPPIDASGRLPSVEQFTGLARGVSSRFGPGASEELPTSDRWRPGWEEGWDGGWTGDNPTGRHQRRDRGPA